MNPQGKRAAQAQATRDALVAAARVEFMEAGYEGASLRAIGKRAGLSTGAIFANWEGKDGLFSNVMALHAEVRRARMDELETHLRNLAQVMGGNRAEAEALILSLKRAVYSDDSETGQLKRAALAYEAGLEASKRARRVGRSLANPREPG